MNEYYEDLIEHSMWLNRMRPRIEILRNLLCEEGIIFIQISDEEQAYLKVLCDEVFGRRNFVNMISVNMKNVAGASGGGEDKKLKKNCEFILVYDRGMSWFPHHQGGANKPVLERRPLSICRGLLDSRREREGRWQGTRSYGPAAREALQPQA